MPIVTGLQANVFRAVSGSLFSSPVNWSRGIVPTGSDVAMIADNCTIDISRTIGSLVVRAPFTASINTGLTLQVNDVIDVKGHLSCSGAPNIISAAKKNNINSLSAGNSNFTYLGEAKQPLAGGNYYNLTLSTPISGSSYYNLPISSFIDSKRVTSNNLNVSGNLLLNDNAILDLGDYHLYVSGSTQINTNNDRFGLIRKTGLGNVVFNGPLNLAYNSRLGLDFSGNPNVECRAGINSQVIVSGLINTGKGTWTFSTNNQDIRDGLLFYSPIIISGSIHVSMSSTNGNPHYLLDRINGTEAASTLINKGIMYIYYTGPAPMTTGSFNYLTYPSTIGYLMNTTYTLPYTTYRSLSVGGTGTSALKSLSGSTYVSESLFLFNDAQLQLGNYDLTISGSTTLGQNNDRTTTILKSGPGRVTFGGQLFSAYNSQNIVDFSQGNPTVEFKNGIYITAPNNPNIIKAGTGSWYFTTNNQAIGGSGGQPVYVSAPLIISGGIELSINNSGYILVLSNTINGTEAASRFINRGSLYLSTSSSLNGSALTGSFDFTSSANTLGFAGDYTATIPTRFNTLRNLVVQGLGIKTLATSSYISGSLIIGDNGGPTLGILDLGNYDLILSGNLLMNNPYNPITNPTILKKSGPGNVTFISTIIPQNNGTIDFATGSPNVEVRNGIQLGSTNYFYTGTGSWSFTTNNQSIGISIYGSTLNFNGPVVVGPGISLTLSPGHTFYINNNLGISGSSSTSRLINSGALYFNNINAATFSNGIFDYTGSTNTIAYSFSGNYTLPYNYYYNLIIQGTGSKSISSNTTISGSLVLGIPGGNTPGILELGNYDLFVSGVFDINNPSPNLTALTKSGSGNVIFNGLVSCQNAAIIDFNIGNPNVELRNGIKVGATQNTIKTGTGSWYFSTNNQDIGQTIYGGTLTFDCPILIASNKTLNVGTIAASNITMRREINGENASSLLKAGNGNSTIYYNSPQQPMLTGLIDFSSSLNTFVYNSGSQNVKGGIYRNLTFLNGLKTLQGNVSVLGTFSTGSGVTSGSYNLNGFTLTNP